MLASQAGASNQWTGRGKPWAPSDKKESRGLEGRLIYHDGKGSEQQA